MAGKDLVRIVFMIYKGARNQAKRPVEKKHEATMRMKDEVRLAVIHKSDVSLLLVQPVLLALSAQIRQFIPFFALFASNTADKRLLAVRSENHRTLGKIYSHEDRTYLTLV